MIGLSSMSCATACVHFVTFLRALYYVWSCVGEHSTLGHDFASLHNDLASCHAKSWSLDLNCTLKSYPFQRERESEKENHFEFD